MPGSTPEKPASHWIWIVVVLIGINITVLVVMFVRPDRVQDSVATVPAAETSSEVPEEASFSEFVAEARSNQRPAAEVTVDPLKPAPVAAAPQSMAPAPAIAANKRSVITESFATFNDLRAQGILQLPDMHLDIHVYSSEPDDRFVFVNMSKYKEKATLDEGPVVMEITPDGVILEYRGTGFLLPRE